jgi:hypothetical protein
MLIFQNILLVMILTSTSLREAKGQMPYFGQRLLGAGLPYDPLTRDYLGFLYRPTQLQERIESFTRKRVQELIQDLGKTGAVPKEGVVVTASPQDQVNKNQIPILNYYNDINPDGAYDFG